MADPIVVTMANTDATIVAQVAAILELITIDEAAVFKTVEVTTTREDAAQRLIHANASPAALVHYQHTTEQPTHDKVIGGAVGLELILAVKDDSEADRVTNLCKLRNAVLNAFNGTPPAASAGYAIEGEAINRVSFGEGEYEYTKPWAICYLPMTVGYQITNPTSH